jgi:hypothetical protein
MFCPACKVEYRAGFTRCSDCGAKLVERLEETPIHTNKPEVPRVAELLWTGNDARMRDEIIATLEAMKILHHERSDKVGALRNWSEEVYAIFTHARDHRAATAALEEALRRRQTAPEEADDEPGDSDSSVPEPQPPEDDSDDDLSDVRPDYVPEDFDPNEATVEVWSGQDATIRENLITFLGNIGIGSATSESSGQLRIRVTPESQKRAQEMIRQVTDASAPRD